ncbi:hypothetical protein EGW08_000989 [Elysia chlorotica]|uniref:Hexosyltransferase n=1 Tax=Elysia chlorotica TaxID=188477 RepID=A0A3S1AGE0_ELYCH|nr:hypothetical protein EGW08_000989 [Elysia chlorotica]
MHPRDIRDKTIGMLGVFFRKVLSTYAPMKILLCLAFCVWLIRNLNNSPTPSGPATVRNVTNITHSPKKAQVLVTYAHNKLITKKMPAVKKPVARPTRVPLTSMSKKLLGRDFFRDVIFPSTSCSGRNIELIICVPTNRDNAAVRDAIRLTWGSYAWNGNRLGLNTTTIKEGSMGEIMIVFFVGSSSLVSSKDKQDKLFKEAKIYGDIYQADFIDTYQNLTLKSISILNFVSLYCPNARYVAKIDDDIYVSIPVLMKEVKLVTKRLAVESHNKSNGFLTTPKFAWGFLFRAASPMRKKNHKWYTSLEDYSPKFYPNYLSGTAYVMSGTAALSLYEATLKVPIFWMEDIYVTGMCAAFARIPLIDGTRKALFSIHKRSEPTGCVFRKVISGHTYKPIDLITIHAQLNSPFLKC